jgi:hypothetical protein
MTELTGMVGFASPIAAKALSRRRTIGVELIATMALAVSLIIAAAAVTFGVARAQGVGAVGDSHRAPLTVAVLLGAVMAGVCGLTVVAARGPSLEVSERGPNPD